ncbi:MAG: NAD-dependent epimerase/dehydratase family protein [Myxococcota bacterium]
MRIAVAGATGFIGTALCDALLAEGHEVVGLSRRPRAAHHRACDLFSLTDVEEAVEGCEVAVYLVHSMLPSARLTQASFADLDLVLADNFARACAKHRVRQIVYLGGFIPEGEALSAHLQSRLEVEEALASHGTPVTALRAGLVVGPGGSSLRILVNLVRRLPAMITPAWTLNPTQPIALRDVVRAFRVCIGNRAYFGGCYDIGGPDVMSYREMMQRTARVLGVERAMVGVPFFSTGLSKLWVSLVTGTPMELVGPLVDSLRHPMVGNDNPLQQAIATGAQPFDAALREAATVEPRSPAQLLQRVRRRVRQTRSVRSVQRLTHPQQSATWVGEEYVRWLPTVPIPGLACDTHGDIAHFRLRGIKQPLLTLRRVPHPTEGVGWFEVTGGLLAIPSDPPGRLEFRSVLGGRYILSAVHDFQPRLPWLLYNATQALGHLMVMHLFGKHLGRIAAAPA